MIEAKMQAGRPRTGIVFNSLSGRNRKDSKGLIARLNGLPGAEFREVSEFHQMPPSLHALIEGGIDLLVVAGGDGTVQEVIKYLLSSVSSERWPLLTVIPGGTTNMTAADLGIRGAPKQVIDRLHGVLRQNGSPKLVQRRALCIEERGKPANYGMFFGAGLIARGVKYSRSKIKGMGLTGGIFSTLITLRCLAGFVFGGGNGAWRAVEMRIDWGGGKSAKGPYLFAFASTLDRLIFGSRPYWGNKKAPIHVTVVKQHPRFSWWGFVRILRGRGGELAGNEAYDSDNSEKFVLTLNDEYIIDGELYQTDPRAGELRISATEAFTFLIP